MRKKPGTTERPTPKPRRPSAAGKPPQASPNGPNDSRFRPFKNARRERSEVIDENLRARRRAGRRAPVQRSAGARFRVHSDPAPQTRAGNISGARQQKIEERIAAATEELSAGITEAASAAEELRRSMEQIASGAEEAASAAQETLAVATYYRDNAGAGARPLRGRAPPDRRAGNAADRNLEPDRDCGPAISSTMATGRPGPSRSWRS